MPKPSPESLLMARVRADPETYDLLHSLAQDMSFRRAPAALLDQALGRVSRILRVEAASLFLMNEGTGLLDFAAMKGLNVQALKELDTHLKPGEGLAGWVFEQGQPAVVNEPEKDPRFKPGLDWLTGFKTRNILAVPLRLAGKPLGVLEVVNRRKKEPFTDEDAALLSALGQLLATPLDNLRALSFLNTSQALLQALLVNLEDAFLAVDHQGRLVHANKSALDLFGWDAPPQDRPAAEALAAAPDLGAALSQALSGEKPQVQRRLSFSPRPGLPPREFLCRAFPLANTRGAGVLIRPAIS